ncbi:MAG TPA: hypothetical protein VH744_08230 [Terriglobales bacterium]
MGRPLGCTLDPQCPGLARDEEIAIPYNQTLFLPGARHRTIVQRIIDKYYRPYTPGQFEIVITDQSAGEEHWATVDKIPNGGKRKLTVSRDLFYTSPPFLVSSIGHEMIHVAQYTRPQAPVSITISGAVDAFHELEAYEWQLGATNFSWPIKPSSLYPCFLEGQNRDEKQHTQTAILCYGWQIKNGIEKSRLRGRTELERWLPHNPWSA